MPTEPRSIRHALRTLLQAQRTAALGSVDEAGAPFVSMVPFAAAPALGGLVIHVSLLAAHTGHLLAGPAVSLLITQRELPGEPVHALPRVTLAGRAELLELGSAPWLAARAAYLARFPEAEPITEFGDFRFFAVHVERGRHIAGFGAARDVDGDEVRRALASPMARQATAADAEAACDAMRRCIADCCTADHGDDPALLDAWLRHKTPEAVRALILAEGCNVVAELGGRVCGFARASIAGKLLLCYVAPEARGTGAGSAMLAAVEDHARSAGLQALQLDSTRTALSFYRRHGYAEAGPAARIFGMQSQPMSKSLAR